MQATVENVDISKTPDTFMTSWNREGFSWDIISTDNPSKIDELFGSINIVNLKNKPENNSILSLVDVDGTKKVEFFDYKYFKEHIAKLSTAEQYANEVSKNIRLSNALGLNERENEKMNTKPLQVVSLISDGDKLIGMCYSVCGESSKVYRPLGRSVKKLYNKWVNKDDDAGDLDNRLICAKNGSSGTGVKIAFFPGHPLGYLFFEGTVKFDKNGNFLGLDDGTLIIRKKDMVDVIKANFDRDSIVASDSNNLYQYYPANELKGYAAGNISWDLKTPNPPPYMFIGGKDTVCLNWNYGPVTVEKNTQDNKKSTCTAMFYTAFPSLELNTAYTSDKIQFIRKEGYREDSFANDDNTKSLFKFKYESDAQNEYCIELILTNIRDVYYLRVYKLRKTEKGVEKLGLFIAVSGGLITKISLVEVDPKFNMSGLEYNPVDATLEKKDTKGNVKEKARGAGVKVKKLLPKFDDVKETGVTDSLRKRCADYDDKLNPYVTNSHYAVRECYDIFFKAENGVFFTLQKKMESLDSTPSIKHVVTKLADNLTMVQYKVRNVLFQANLYIQAYARSQFDGLNIDFSMGEKGPTLRDGDIVLIYKSPYADSSDSISFPPGLIGRVSGDGGKVQLKTEFKFSHGNVTEFTIGTEDGELQLGKNFIIVQYAQDTQPEIAKGTKIGKDNILLARGTSGSTNQNQVQFGVGDIVTFFDTGTLTAPKEKYDGTRPTSKRITGIILALPGSDAGGDPYSIRTLHPAQPSDTESKSKYIVMYLGDDGSYQYKYLQNINLNLNMKKIFPMSGEFVIVVRDKNDPTITPGIVVGGTSDNNVYKIKLASEITNDDVGLTFPDDFLCVPFNMLTSQNRDLLRPPKEPNSSALATAVMMVGSKLKVTGLINSDFTKYNGTECTVTVPLSDDGYVTVKMDDDKTAELLPKNLELYTGSSVAAAAAAAAVAPPPTAAAASPVTQAVQAAAVKAKFSEGDRVSVVNGSSQTPTVEKLLLDPTRTYTVKSFDDSNSTYVITDKANGDMAYNDIPENNLAKAPLPPPPPSPLASVVHKYAIDQRVVVVSGTNSDVTQSAVITKLLTHPNQVYKVISFDSTNGYKIENILAPSDTYYNIPEDNLENAPSINLEVGGIARVVSSSDTQLRDKNVFLQSFSFSRYHVTAASDQKAEFDSSQLIPVASKAEVAARQEAIGTDDIERLLAGGRGRGRGRGRGTRKYQNQKRRGNGNGNGNMRRRITRKVKRSRRVGVVHRGGGGRGGKIYKKTKKHVRGGRGGRGRGVGHRRTIKKYHRR